ncbi:Pentatricopeptide repeat-containing protein [Acorus calamus]|uniref:Pentatricopeptide repeat-containing protein n=1 Tax=Acorus calamus TaxID=4465 RepID=A0AAV9EQL7_ACOCL|nr:Pentatricopeptide repeat-containing protein [Acorus calamus]
MVSRGLDGDNLFVSGFIEASSQLGYTDYAYSVFQHKQRHNIYLYNAMIKALSRSSSPKDAVFLFDRIQRAGLRPDTYSFPFALKAVSHLGSLESGRSIHGQAVRVGLGSDVHVATCLVHMYTACRSVSDARRMFDETRDRDVCLWNTMVAGYAKLGDVDNARELFERMPERNVVSWTAVIAGYAQMNRPDEAICVFRMMQLERVEPDEIALLAALSACAALGALELGEWIHNYIEKRGMCKIVPLMNALMDMYVKSGNIGKALEVFEKMGHRSIVTWTTMIAGLALHGLGVEALEMFTQMERENVKPNSITFIAILSACSHVGLVEMGRFYFNCMTSKYHIRPTIEHYGCMVDLLGRAGCLQEARDLIIEMPFRANAAIWGALLAASRIHKSVELGEWALKHLTEVEPHNAGNYSLLSNTYAALGKWEDAGKVRKAMRDHGVRKPPGGSSIEVNGAVHEFIARDMSHSQSERIYDVVFGMDEQLKMIGCVPNLDGVFIDFD